MLITNFNQHTMQHELAAMMADAHEIWISTGYIDLQGIARIGLADAVRDSTRRAYVLVGRAGEEGLAEPTFRVLDYLNEQLAGRGGVRIANPPTHAKTYCFVRNSEVQAFVGSSNLTLHGMRDWHEINVQMEGRDAEEALLELQRMWQSSRPLSEVQVRDRLPRVSASRRFQITRVPSEPVPSEPGVGDETPVISLSLLARNGEVQRAAGLNWWAAGGRARNANEAYIALPAELFHNRSAEVRAVFGGVERGTIFHAMMHDGTAMDMMLEGGDEPIPKQICSRGDKRIFGQWILRDVLRLPPGTPVTRAILEAYGRTDIAFYRIGTDPNTNLATVFVDFRV